MAVKDISKQKIQDLTGRYRTGIRIVLLLAIALIITLVVLKIRKALRKPANATYVPGGGPIPVGWDPTALTDELFKTIDGTLVLTGTMQDVFEKFNALNDNQMIQVYNKWLDKNYDKEKKYYMFPYGTLTNAIIDKVGYGAFGMNQKDLAETNLKRLHLS